MARLLLVLPASRFPKIRITFFELDVGEFDRDRALLIPATAPSPPLLEEVFLDGEFLLLFSEEDEDDEDEPEIRLF